MVFSLCASTCATHITAPPRTTVARCSYSKYNLNVGSQKRKGRGEDAGKNNIGKKEYKGTLIMSRAYHVLLKAHWGYSDGRQINHICKSKKPHSKPIHITLWSRILSEFKPSPHLCIYMHTHMHTNMDMCIDTCNSANVLCYFALVCIG